ncbi:acyl-coenzyme A oxidase 2 [Trichomonascus vanleenenianus]|uniref:acyl-coenzyme A oxidase 2 n=1 Tax=Trichomonascus vanleenenianus TaxID=2268995 RepID=UPI003ECAF9B8
MSLSPNQTANVEIGGKQYNTFTEPPVALAQERENTAFPVRELTYYIDGGKENTERLEQIMTSIERNPAFSNDDFYDVTKAEQREITFDRVGQLAEIIATAKDDEDITRHMSIIGMLDGNTTTRAGIHFGLFFSAIRGSGTPEQLAYWTKKGAATYRRFYGCFCMTELGHGSNVAGMETTATYDRSTDEFIIHTPHVGATKWWIGGAAHSANHTVVFARLIIDGKDYGVKSFVVPLRSVSDHSLLPGIAIGDIGKKMGRDGIDNGWVQFTNVRIPRQYMLMRYAKVDSDGKVTEPPLAQLAYGALIGGRVSMAADSFHTAKRFLTIAIRYAAIRRQFSSTPGEPETKILDYTYHQRRLMPRLAYAFAMQAGSKQLSAFAKQANARLAAASTSNKADLQSAIDDVKELFTVSAGLKASSTWGTAEIIDQCRQACGGHGYSGYNGFGQGYNDWVVQCTWEGDNNVLMLSTGRSLIQSGLAVRQGKRVGKAVDYLQRAQEIAHKKLDGRDIRDPKVIVEAWESASARGINQAVDQYIELTEKKGLNKTQAFEELSQQRFEIARIHTRYYIIKAFFDSIESSAASIKPVLTDLATLFGLWSLESDAASFLKSGYIQTGDIDKITAYVNDYNKKVRDNAIGITDAFNLSDFYVNAPIGSHDGNAYKHYFEKVLRRNPNRDSKAPYHDAKIKPFLFRALEEQDDVTEMDV